MVKADPFLVQSILNPDGMSGMTITEDMAGAKLATCTAMVNAGVEQLNAMLTQDELRDQLLSGAFDDTTQHLCGHLCISKVNALDESLVSALVSIQQ